MPEANTRREAEDMVADASGSSTAEEQTRCVDVGGHQLVLHAAGTGWPTVVLEAGAGLSSDTWDAVWQPLARLTHVVRYDRAGLGASAPGPARRTYRDMAADLHTLLQRAGCAGPYLLVGHSLGGLLVRVVASQYPTEVVGLVLVDAVHPEQNQRAFALLPPERADESRELASLRRNLQRIRDGTATERADDVERLDWYASEAQAQALGALDDLPLAVLTQGRPLAFAPDVPPDFAAYIAHAYHPMFLELQAELAALSSRSRHLLAARSGHMIHQDEPELVIASVRELVEAVRHGNQPLVR
jgi:pimeloyl-ACP methyl ester carboxylesterase